MKYMEVARKYNKRDPSRPLNTSERKLIIGGSKNVNTTEDCVSIDEERNDSF